MTAKEFIKFMIETPEIYEKFAVCKTPDEAYAIARKAGMIESFEVFKQEVIWWMEQETRLSDGELEQAAGGAPKVGVPWLPKAGMRPGMAWQVDTRWIGH